MDLTIDSNGNPILSGIFTDSIHLGNSNYISYGHEDIFILKCDQNGNIKWSKHGGGVSGEFAYGISNDEFGGVYIGTHFQGPDLFLDSITLHSAVNNSNDLFVAKYDSSGVIK
ncbi:MAG: hypothetical protein IPJ66_14280 [Bacteroidetes bacterium]|nr:hypothetical protein [Bacteroidota bacterium]